MRSIKFRAWDAKNKKFPMVGFHVMGEHTVFDLVNQYRLEEALDLEIQQFTGFCDKNGKEVYEGDIVQLGFDTTDCHWSKLKAEVVWWLNGFYFQTNYGAIAQDTYYQIKYCEVVGNIFENPDLVPTGKLTV